MVDIIDLANDRAEADIDRAIAAARAASDAVIPGYAGDCDFCGEWSGRLVGGACAGCRDRYHLP